MQCTLGKTAKDLKKDNRIVSRHDYIYMVYTLYSALFARLLFFIKLHILNLEVQKQKSKEDDTDKSFLTKLSIKKIS